MNFKRTNTEEEFKESLFIKPIEIDEKYDEKGIEYGLLFKSHRNLFSITFKYNHEKKYFYRRVDYYTHNAFIKYLNRHNVPYFIQNQDIIIDKKYVDLNGYEL